MTIQTRLRAFLAILGMIGVSMQIYEDGFGMLLYYTVWSNLLVIGSLWYLVYTANKQRSIKESTNLYRYKAGVTMAIVITFLVYHFMLAPLVAPKEYWNIRNFLVHYIVPLGFIMDTIVSDKVKQYRLTDPLKWTIFPLVYFTFALLNGLVMKLPIPDAKDSPFPYFFLNVNKFGVTGVAQYTVIIFIAYVLLGYILLLLKRFVGKK